MEDDEEESSRTKPPFWIQTNSNSNSNSNTITLHPRSNKLNLFSAFFLFLLLFISSFLLLTFLLLLYPPNITTTLNLNHLFFKKGWDSINFTLLLLALIFGFFSQNHHRHDSNNVTDGDDRSAYAGPSNPRTVGFHGKHENDSVVRGWFEYSDRPSAGPNTFVDGDDRWIGFSNTNIYHEQFDRIHVMVDNEVHKSNESISQADETSEGVVIKSLDSTGIVLEVRGKFVCVRGLDGVTEGEVVEFDDDGTIGIVVTNRVSNDNVGVALLSEGTSIRQGSFVKATGKIAQVPENVGRVVDVLGGNIDGRCENNDSEIKEVTPAVRRRKRRTAESIANNGRSSEETSGVEQKGGKTSHRRTKSSGLELPSEKSSHRKTKSSCFERFGTVLLVGNGVARIYGFDEVTDGEVVEFEDGTIGIVTNSESANNVGVVLMGDGLLIQEGSLVKATGKVAEIPVSEARLGSVINALAKPIDDKGKNYGSESLVSEERETKRMPPAVRHRNRRTAGSIQEKGKLTEETNGSEIEVKLIHRKTKRTHEESVTTPPKVETSDEIEAILYESSPEKLVQDAPQSERNERKSATREFLTSLTKRKKKQRQKSVDSLDDYDTMPESQPPSPPPPSKGFFSSKKGKGKKVIEVPLPPPPPQQYVASREQKSVPTTDSAAARRPPLPVKVQNFVESSFTGAESPLHPVPSPPPPPPFKMSSWKFVVKGDYVNIGSVNSSRSVSPEREEVESHMSIGGGDVAMGSMFCPSPDVNSKADVFIAKFREGLKLQKMNSMKMKQRGVGLSNLGSVSSNDQARAN